MTLGYYTQNENTCDLDIYHNIKLKLLENYLYKFGDKLNIYRKQSGFRILQNFSPCLPAGQCCQLKGKMWLKPFLSQVNILPSLKRDGNCRCIYATDKNKKKQWL